MENVYSSTDLRINAIANASQDYLQTGDRRLFEAQTKNIQQPTFKTADIRQDQDKNDSFLLAFIEGMARSPRGNIFLKYHVRANDDWTWGVTFKNRKNEDVKIIVTQADLKASWGSKGSEEWVRAIMVAYSKYSLRLDRRENTIPYTSNRIGFADELPSAFGFKTRTISDLKDLAKQNMIDAEKRYLPMMIGNRIHYMNVMSYDPQTQTIKTENTFVDNRLQDFSFHEVVQNIIKGKIDISIVDFD